MHLVDLFDPCLLGRPEHNALEFGGQHLTFGQLEIRSNCLANRLAADGFQPGDRLAVYLVNCPELIDAYLAAIKLGLILVPINALYRERELAHIFADAEPRGVITSIDLEPYLASALRKNDGMKRYDAEQLAGAARDFSPERPPCPVEGGAPAALVYTSGTTGRSKGALLTHSNFAVNAQNLVTCWQLTADDRLLLALPLFHVHGLGNGLHTWLASGFRLCLLERFRKETIVDEFLEFRPTVFFGVPAMYERLLEVPPDQARQIGAFMRLFVSGSAPLPARSLERFEQLYGHVILERYGMTETLMNTSNPYAGERRPGSVGKPLPGVSIRLVDPETGEGVAAGETGEIQIKGPNVFPGYWRQPEATAEAFTADGFFRSGDLAVCSPDRYYRLEGRRSELIISGGFNIYPREIEEFLAEQPGVLEAAVVGVPDRVRGEVPIAYLVSEPGEIIDTEALAACCRQHLASFKAPREFRRVAHLPRNALGKIRRHLLAAE